MKFAQVNINRGFGDKVHEVVEWASTLELQIIAVAETGLCPEACSKDHDCAVIPYIEGWKWVGKARNNRGGGVGFLLRADIAFTVREDMTHSELEQLWIEVFRDTLPSLLVCSVYIPPLKKQALQAFSDEVTRARERNRLMLIMGDFNARSEVFGDSCDNPLADSILGLISTADMSIVNDFGIPTVSR